MKNAVYPFNPGEADVFVVHCSDPRFQDAFEQFMRDLGIERPALVVVPGSILPFGEAGLVDQFAIMRHQLELLMHKNPRTARVVLIGHECCAAYHQVEQSQEIALSAEQDLDYAADVVKQVAAHHITQPLEVELYMARVVGDGVVFEQVKDNPPDV